MSLRAGGAPSNPPYTKLFWNHTLYKGGLPRKAPHPPPPPLSHQPLLAYTSN